MAKSNKRKQDNRILIVLIAILLICFIVIGYLFYTYFYAGASGSKYGDRLDGIESYSLSSTLSDDIKKIYDSEKSVGNVNVNVQGRVIYINIDFVESIKIETAQSIAVKSLDAIGSSNLTFYEIQYILNYTGSEENENFPIFGSKGVNSLKVVW